MMNGAPHYDIPTRSPVLLMEQLEEHIAVYCLDGTAWIAKANGEAVLITIPDKQAVH